MVAEFRGPPPHDLGTAELATAHALDEHIEVMLHLLDDWHRPMGPIVRVQMTPDVARALAERLNSYRASPQIDRRPEASSLRRAPPRTSPFSCADCCPLFLI